MAAPAITLGLGQVLVTVSGTGSALGVVPIQNSVQFGVVAAINDLCDSVTAGDSVMFIGNKGQQIQYGSTIYILIDEQHITGIETDLP